VTLASINRRTLLAGAAGLSLADNRRAISDSGATPRKDVYQIGFELDDQFIARARTPLPGGWDSAPPYSPNVQAVGDRWIRGGSSLGLPEGAAQKEIAYIHWRRGCARATRRWTVEESSDVGH
jgi:hypothetical protein